MNCFPAPDRLVAQAESMGINMYRFALAALVTISPIGTAQAATIIGFQPLANVTGTAVPVTYTESGYTIQSNNTREPFPGVVQNSTLSLQKFAGTNDSGIPGVNFARSTSFFLTGGTFTFDGLSAYFSTINGTSNSFTVVGSLLDKDLYSMTFTSASGIAQPNNVYRTLESGSSLIFDKLVFTAGSNIGTTSLDDIRVSAATIPTPTPVVPPVTAAVPEPATWAMMMLGFGAIGASMRRRRSNVQSSVRFA